MKTMEYAWFVRTLPTNHVWAVERVAHGLEHHARSSSRFFMMRVRCMLQCRWDAYGVRCKGDIWCQQWQFIVDYIQTCSRFECAEEGYRRSKSLPIAYRAFGHFWVCYVSVTRAVFVDHLGHFPLERIAFALLKVTIRISNFRICHRMTRARLRDDKTG